jgi:hypothetical protein
MGHPFKIAQPSFDGFTTVAFTFAKSSREWMSLIPKWSS